MASLYQKRKGLFFVPVHHWKALPVRLKSAQSFSRFLMLLSECDGNAFLISSMRILRGRSLLFQNKR